MVNVPVISSVVPIFPSGANDALTLFNNGPDTIYLGSDSSLSVSSGFPLGIGSAIVWDATRPLYAICDIQEYSTLCYIENAGPSSLGTVTLASGSTVTTTGDSATPALYWPCTSGEANPPTLSGMTYTTSNGNPCIKASGNGVATWSALALRGGSGITVVTFLMFVGNVNTIVYAGWNSSPQNIGRALFQYSPLTPPTAAAVLNGSNVDISKFIGTWLPVELVYTATMTRLTVNRDTTKRVSTDPLTDSEVTSAFQLGIGSISQWALTNLGVNYPASVPA